MAVPPLNQLRDLRCPVDASRFLFSSLSSLHVCVDELGNQSLLNFLWLLETIPSALHSLRRLHVDDAHGLSEEGDVAELSFSSLSRLQGLTHCRIALMKSSAPSCSSLVSALLSMQSLTFLDLGGSIHAWSQLLPLLCSDAATPLLLRLQTLVLPPHRSNCFFVDVLDAPYDAFLCKLSSLPAPPPLKHFQQQDRWGGSTKAYRAAGLLSVFSLPHLTLLNLTGVVGRTEFCAFASSFTSASASLVSLVFPNVQREDDDGDRDEAVKAEDAAAVKKAARLLLSRLTTLQELYCDIGMLSGAVALPDSLPGNTTGGCSASLYRLNVRGLRLLPFPCHASLSFPQLTELSVDLPLKNAELELLLSGCPQLLVLSCTVWHSWHIVLIAARCCPRLLNLTVSVRCDEAQAGDAAFTEAEPDISGRFLPELIALRLTVNADSFADIEFALPISCVTPVLLNFTASPHAQLQSLALDGPGLTAEHVLSLADLPRLSYLDASDDGASPLTSEAARRTRQWLSSRGPEDDSQRDQHVLSMARRENCEGGLAELQYPPLGPHQVQEMRQRVLGWVEADHYTCSNLLASKRGVPRDTVRALFFAELRSVMAVRAASAGDDETDCDAATSLSSEW